MNQAMALRRISGQKRLLQALELSDFVRSLSYLGSRSRINPRLKRRLKYKSS